MTGFKHWAFIGMFFSCLIAYSAIYAAQPGDVVLNVNGPWVPDLGNGNYKNPVLNADYSDPDVVRVGSDYYLTSSSFNCTPGLQILHSKDLVNWTIIGNVFTNQIPLSVFSVPQPANGVWAPSIRYHNETFYVTYGDPDYGVYLAKAKNPQGPWDLKLIKSIKGWIDVCPFWDTDGQGYIVHAYANSRIGYSDMLTLRKLSNDDSSISDSIPVVDAKKDASGLLNTVEGAKLYKKDTYYYILAPAGGVTKGWQLAMRTTSLTSKSWEIKKVMDQGNTTINGPHQGGWVTTPDEKESWFLHFQDKGAFGRVVHLEPMKWVNNWPVIGDDANNDGIGNPVLTYKKPAVGQTFPLATPGTSDNFDSDTLGLQWQWYANSKPEWHSLTENRGNLRLYSVESPAQPTDYTKVPNLLMQKFCADSFSFTTKTTLHALATGDRAGIIVVGTECFLLAIVKKADGFYLISSVGDNAADIKLTDSTLFLRTDVWRNRGDSARCTFKYSTDGKLFKQYGNNVLVAKVKWIGAKFGVFSIKPKGSASKGYADFAWVNVDTYNAPLVETGIKIVPKVANENKELFVNPDISEKSILFGFVVHKKTMMTLSLFSALGEKIIALKEKEYEPGYHEVLIDKPALTKGVYFCVATIGSKRMVRNVFVGK